MACKKVHGQGKINVIVNIQSLIHPYTFHNSKDVGKGLCIFTITFILPCPCTFWHAIPTSLFFLMTSFLYHNLKIAPPSKISPHLFLNEVVAKGAFLLEV